MSDERIPEVGAEGRRIQLEPQGGAEAVDGEVLPADGDDGVVAAALPNEINLFGVGASLASQQNEVVVLTLGHSTVGFVWN